MEIVAVDIGGTHARFAIAEVENRLQKRITDFLYEDQVADWQRSGVLTLGALFALYFSSSGVESLRVGLNRAYGLRESRPWWLTRLESIGYVICGAFAMLAFAVFNFLRRDQGVEWRQLAFFFLGVGFTLVESAAVARLALLFGAVWIVSAIVFFTALFMVFLANLSVWYRIAISQRVAWAGLLLLLLGNYLVSIEWLLSFGTPLRLLLCFGLVGLPVYFSGICFSTLFEQERNMGSALGLNLVGAMVGGLLEYLSMLFGMRSIWLLAALVYLLALFSLRNRYSGSSV